MGINDIKVIHLAETDSTNRYLNDYHGDEGRMLTVVRADYQREGRGQGDNYWESEPGKNLTFSVRFHPKGLPVAQRYALQQAGALAVCDALSHYGEGFTIKWPNDIYWHDFKVSGTLSTCSIVGSRVSDCILGVGLNVNQLTFRSDAPNPMSLAHVVGHEVPLDEVFGRVVDHLRGWLARLDAGDLQSVVQAYLGRLYHRTGFYWYEDAQGLFEAEIAGVAPDGILLLHDRQGQERRYEFKEVRFVLSPSSRQCNGNSPKIQ